jgi:cobalt-zinc-cadmium efflux system outer membrane protein
MRVTLLAAILCGFLPAALPGPATAQSTPAPSPVLRSALAPASLGELVERAWQLSREDSAKQSRRLEFDARADATRSPFANAPSVSLDLRRDLPPGVGLPGTTGSEERGKNEWEPGVSIPLWLPGQRDAIRRTIERERDTLDASARRMRWLQHAQQSARLESTRALEADVARRVAAGDLARSDLWTAQAETRAAEAAVAEAGGRLAEARAALTGLTGLDDVDAADEPASSAATDGHPALQAASQGVEAARARLAQTRATMRDNPTFSVVARFDRDSYDSPYRNTVRMGIAIPLATEARNAPRLAAAGAELVELEVAFERERRRIAAEQRRAVAALDAARDVLSRQEDRARLARDAFGAIERAFRAGERSLPQLLQLRAVLLDAELSRELARARVGAALARLNQANGDLP